MTTKSKSPQIRFRGFSGEWNNKKFGECVLIQRGGSPRPIEKFITQNENGINWIKIGDVSTGSRYITKTKEKIIPEGEKHSRKVFIGDLILSNSMSFGRPYIMAIEGCIHDGWLLIRDEKKMFNLEYLLQLLSSDYMISQYRALASGGVVINLNSELVQSTNVYIPNKAEQTKIGDYFQKLDKLIEQKEKKYQKLKQFKKAMLSKMFPKNGADTPEIRFRGFSGKWEEKRLGDIATFTKGKGISKADVIDSGQMLCVRYGELYTAYNEVITTIYSRTNSNIDMVYSQENDILMPTSDVTPRGLATASALSQSGIILGGDILIIRSEEIVNSFFSYFVSSHKNKIIKLVSGTTVFHLYAKDIENLYLHLPSKKEQTKIGHYFQKLDSQIDLQLQELEKLKNLKKASLSKMFV
jgi:type I restriction enzyme S subunit